MATISKFYLLDATSPNTGTLPSGALIDALTEAPTTTGDATGALTARDATDTPGTANPDTKSLVTALLNQTNQIWGHRRFCSRPLAAQNVPANTSWTWSYARQENNLNHNMALQCDVYLWRPSTGNFITGSYASSRVALFSGLEPTVAATEQAESRSSGFSSSDRVTSDGDILVFEVTTNFSQSKSSALTEQFSYNGTTEASTTTCATFVSPPSALTLFTGAPPASLLPASTPLQASALYRM